MDNTKIEWSDHTVNFWWGCTMVSAGCMNCYADTWSKRWKMDIWGVNKPRSLKKAGWKDIKRYNKNSPDQFSRHTRVFCQSMSDTFEDHPQLTMWRDNALQLMESCSNLQVQLLTKRPENVMRMVPSHWLNNWPSHIWIGTSVENQKQADKRIPELLKIPAKVRFLSMEPLLEHVDLSRLYGIDWVIVGGESGANHRPFDVSWARSIRDQCKENGVPFFMKQMGGKRKPFPPIPDDLMIREFTDTC